MENKNQSDKKQSSGGQKDSDNKNKGSQSGSRSENR